jgi:hypothetical protein
MGTKYGSTTINQMANAGVWNEPSAIAGQKIVQIHNGQYCNIIMRGAQ